MSMTVDEMRKKLVEWRPNWNVDKFTSDQISAIYNKERNEIVESIIKSYSNSQKKQTL